MKTIYKPLIGLATFLLLIMDQNVGQAAISHSTAWTVAAAVVGQNADAKSKAGALLKQARQAIKRGDYQAADKLISQAEKLNVTYNRIFHLGDTPRKARRDLEDARRNKVDLPSQKASPLNIFAAEKKLPQDPFQTARQNNSTTTSTIPPTNQHPGDQIGLPETSKTETGFGAMPPDATTRLPAIDSSVMPTPQRLPAVGATGTSITRASENRAQSDKLLVAARKALSVGDVRRAQQHLTTAQGLGVSYNSQEDSPGKVAAAIRKYEEVMARRQGRQNDPIFRRQYADVLVEQASALMKWQDYDEAARLATDAMGLNVRYNQFDRTPQMLLQEIENKRKSARAATSQADTRQADQGSPVEPRIAATPQFPVAGRSSAHTKEQAMALVTEGRNALAAGELARANRLAQQAVGMNLSTAQFSPAEDSPWNLLADVQKARTRSANVVQAGGANLVGDRYGQHAQQGVYIQNDDTSYNRQAQATEPSSPTEAGKGVELYKMGQQALRQGNKENALNFFRQAYQHRAALDPDTKSRLQDHLQMLSANAETAKMPAAAQPSMIDTAVSRQQLLARQLSAELAKHQIEVRKVREKNPKKAIQILEQMRGKITDSGLEPAAKSRLIRRVELSVSELEDYIEKNRAQIELDARNRSIEEAVEKDRWSKVEREEKVAEMVEQFNQLMREQRHEEAEVVAKRARELAPDMPVTKQLYMFSQLLRRQRNNNLYNEKKEQAVVNSFDDVRQSAIPFDSRNPFQYDLKTWKDISERRSLSDSGPQRTERELEIIKKLSTPVSCQFDNRPLAEVMDHLSRVSGIDIHLDERGIGEEGVTSDTPVSLKTLGEIALQSALNLILEPLDLSYVVKDEVLKITSAQLRDGEVVTRTYYVADLVIPIPNFSPGSHFGLQGALNDSYSALGYGSNSASPMAMIATADGSNASGMMNPNVLAQMNGARGGASPILSGPGPGQAFGAGPGGAGGASQADFDALIDLITATIQPTTWDEVGGPGSLREFRTNLSLVISNTEEVHQEIVDLLKQLRRLNDLQVTIEVRFITLNDSFFEQIGVDFDFNIDDGVPLDVINQDRVRPSAAVGIELSPNPGGLPNFAADLDVPFRQESFSLAAAPAFTNPQEVAQFGFAILSDIEAFFLVRASQGDRRSNILQAPKVTLFNGQQAFVSDTSQRPFVISVIPVVGDFAAAQQPVIVVLSEGTFMTIQAVVSNDRRYVRLTVVPFFSQIGDVEEFTFQGSETTTDSSSSDENDDGTENSSSMDTSTSRQGTTVQLPTFIFTTVTTTVSVPDGGTVLLGGIKRLSEARNEFGVPLLSKLPYVDRLFRNVGIGRTTSSLMMMVTPRIIIQEEEEEQLLGTSSTP